MHTDIRPYNSCDRRIRLEDTFDQLKDLGQLDLHFILIIIPPFPRVPTGTISSGPVQDTKHLKICPGREHSGSQNKLVSLLPKTKPQPTRQG